MKWFQHQTHSHTDLALRIIISEFGMEGYGFFWICCELVGQQGDKYRLNDLKGWKKALADICKLEEKSMLTILQKFGDLKLVCSKSLKRGELYIPKMKKYSDDYTKKQRRISVQGTDNIPLDKNRIDKIRIEYIRVRELNIKDFDTDDYARTGKAIKALLFKAKGSEKLVCDGLEWISKQSYSWTLETLIKKWPDFMKEAGKPDILKKFEKKDGGSR